METLHQISKHKIETYLNMTLLAHIRCSQQTIWHTSHQYRPM